VVVADVDVAGRSERQVAGAGIGVGQRELGEVALPRGGREDVDGVVVVIG
jgi:hypothetical protein